MKKIFIDYGERINTAILEYKFQIDSLIKAGVNIILFETMNSINETIAALESSKNITIPIWFSFIRIEFIEFSLIARCNLLIFVTVRSSPTICIFVFDVNFPQDFQSSSEKGSSIDLMGYLLIRSK